MADPIEDEDGGEVTNGRSVNEQAGDEPQGEMFPDGVLDGDKKTLRSLVKPGQSVETTVSIGKAEVPLRGGLPDPDKPVRVMVTAQFHKCEPIAQREGDDPKVKSWKLRVHLKSGFTESVPATDDELIRQRFAVLLDQSPAAAGALVEELQRTAASALATA